MPLQRRIPKRGFTNIHRVEFQVVNVRDLARLPAGEVTPKTLHDGGLIGTLTRPVKILGVGEVEAAYQISAHGFSASAREKIEAAGGTVTVLSLGSEGSAEEEAVESAASQDADVEEASAPEGEEASSEVEDEQA